MSSGMTETYADHRQSSALAQRALDYAPQPGLLQSHAAAPSVTRAMAVMETAEPVSGAAGKARIARAMQHSLGNTRIARMGCASCGEDSGEQR